MNSFTSEDNKSYSGTSESERNAFNQKLRAFQYPPMPKRDYELRKMQMNQKVKLITNLFEVKLIDEYHKFLLFSVDITPQIALDNYLLQRQIYTNVNLPESFKKYFWTGNNLYTLMSGDGKDNFDIVIERTVEVNKTEYKVKLKKTKEIFFKNINDFNGTNQQVKLIIENLFRSILLSNPNVIKFHDRTIFEINPKNIQDISHNENKIYKGYMTSAHITENGLFIKINNRNKFISGKTAFQKMIEIRKNLLYNSSIKDLNDTINDFFLSHRTVLTTYGSIKTYKIKEVSFCKNPNNTDITVKDNNGIKKTISIINYYKIQYGIEIKDKNQPLLIVESDNPKKKKLNSNKKDSSSNDDNYVIYLIPELVYITGIEDDDKKNNNRNFGKNVIKKTKLDPGKKMSEIKGISDLVNSENHKIIKKRNGQEIIKKSPKELTKDWGINIGNNLCFQGRIIRQPKLFFKDETVIYIENGKFKSANPYKSVKFTNDNIFFVYDKNEIKTKNFNAGQYFYEIMLKCKNKDFQFSDDFNPKRVKGYGLENTHDWDNINRELRKINITDKNSLGIIFCSQNLERYYYKLKGFFSQQHNIPTQHILTRNLLKKGDSMQFNIIDQINIKRGGMNFYINFENEGIIKDNEVFLIIGLDSKTANKKITYSMTSTINSKLNRFITQEEICDLVNQEKSRTLKKMFEVAIKEVNQYCPHSPDYIILYRQGGNEFCNKKLAISEIENFTDILKEYREKNKNDKNFHFRNTKFYYICCNLKSDLKFFETKENNMSTTYYNPKSGLVVDDNVTQKDKFEFYIQPQYVNEGTATPCHYQVMYYDKPKNEEKALTIENLEKLSFYLTFYYWTWSGAIRIPSLLKMSTTALQFYTKIFNNQQSYLFSDPTYI